MQYILGSDFYKKGEFLALFQLVVETLYIKWNVECPISQKGYSALRLRKDGGWDIQRIQSLQHENYHHNLN